MSASQHLMEVDPRTGLAAGAASLLYAALAGDTQIPFIGVGFSTLVMAVAGSLLAFAYGTPVKGWLRLFGYATGGIFIGIWGVQLIPHAFEWKWYMSGMKEGVNVFQPPLAGFFALVSRWALPLLVESLPALYQRVFNTSSRRGDDQ